MSDLLRRDRDDGRLRFGRPLHAEAGDTLVEVLLALVVMGLAGAALLGAFSTTIGGTAEHRSFATLDTTLQSFAEKASYEIQLQPVLNTSSLPLFASCASLTGTTYQGTPLGYTPPSGITLRARIEYWDSVTSQFTAACPPQSTGPQEIIATASQAGSGHSAVTDSLAFVVSDPFVVFGPPTQLVFVSPTGGGSIGNPISPQPVLAVEDASGRVVTNNSSSVTISVNSGPGAVLGCPGTEAESFGIISFTGCYFTKSGTYTLQASGSGLLGAISNSITVG